MAKDLEHFFPSIDFYDAYGEVRRVVEIIESKTFDGFKKVTYKLHDGEEVSFVIK